ncbi:MAG TPA: xanthine dehydrogenase family protein molybdopterin-binding subunit [Burkholderiaceae bacterium]|nr:xanthine dehydrogenase family protein molybdopterin-binding subunit [Burkholderiaceae bacterium]
MIIDQLLQSAVAPSATVSRRRFVAMSFGGSVGLALLPWASAQQKAADVPPGQKPTEAPSAFVTIAPDGTTTVICNRMDMGQGIETALAMICAEELGADWSKVKTGFGTAAPNYVDPMFGMHLTGGSNSVKNSYMQYRELGARTRAMLLSAAAKRWNASASSLNAANGVVRGAGHSATYGELFADAMKEPIPEQVTLKDPKDFQIIGKPTGLKVSRAKASGQQTYGMDIKLPNMLVAVIAHPPVFGAKVKAFDAEAARKVAGVKAVLPVELDRGGSGVAVVATGYWPAKTGRDALKPEWDTQGLEKVDTATLLSQYRELSRTIGTAAPGEHFRADVSRIASAPNKIEAEFVFPYLNHAQMEPLACAVDLKDDRCDIYTASQMPGVDAMAIGKRTGLAPERVNIHVQMGGGGYGRRAVPTSDYLVESVSVAKALAAAGQRAPVKVIWSREDDLRAGYYRPFTVHRAEIGFDAEGRVLGWDHRIVSQSILTGTPFEAFMIKEGVDATTTEGMREPYDVPMRLQVHHPKVNVPVLWWRSVGSTHTAFVMETLIDEIADAIKQDPVAYRLKLMGDGPLHARHRAALQLAADRAGYGRKTLAPGMHWGVALHESFESVVAYVLEAGVKDGKPVIGAVTSGVHCNFCVNPRTVEAQVFGAATMALSTTLPGAAITFKDGVVEQSNFGDYTVARITDMPKIDVHIVPSSDPPKGMGEPGLPPFAPALANALRRATGKAQRELPFRLA